MPNSNAILSRISAPASTFPRSIIRHIVLADAHLVGTLLLCCVEAAKIPYAMSDRHPVHRDRFCFALWA